MSFWRRPESMLLFPLWIPAFAGMTKLGSRNDKKDSNNLGDKYSVMLLGLIFFGYFIDEAEDAVAALNGIVPDKIELGSAT